MTRTVKSPAFSARCRRRDAMSAMAAAGVLPVLGLAGRRAQAAEDLLVFDWVGYEIAELHQPYIEKYGASPNITMFGDLEEAFQKINAGFRPDLAHIATWDMRRYRDAGLIEPWDTARLQWWPDLLPTLQNNNLMRDADGTQWSIPVDWGINSIVYRTDLVEVDEESWAILWDDRYAGRLANVDEMEAAVTGAALYLGIEEPWNPSEDDVAAIREALEAQRPLLRFYWSDPSTLEQAVVSGEVVAAYAWPASYSTLKADGQPVAYMNPKEGVTAWLEGFVLMKDRDGDTQRAYDFVDAWLAPETGKWMMENYGYGHSNIIAFEIADQAMLAELGLDTPEQTLASSNFLVEIDPDVRERYVRMFEEVKAGF